MKFVPGEHGSRDKVGGLPTHLPPAFPRSPHSGKETAFLGQFYCSTERIPIQEVLCIQLYQCLEDFEPLPVAVVVPKGAPLNELMQGIRRQEIEPFCIEWEYRDDPESIEDWQTDLALSKAGGVCYFMNTVEEHEILLFQLAELPVGFNFGGYTVIVVKTVDGLLDVRLA